MLTEEDVFLTKCIFRYKETSFHKMWCSKKDDGFKGLLHCFSTFNEITGNNGYCFILKNVENCKEKFQRVPKL